MVEFLDKTFFYVQQVYKSFCGFVIVVSEFFGGWGGICFVCLNQFLWAYYCILYFDENISHLLMDLGVDFFGLVDFNKFSTLRFFLVCYIKVVIIL
jgi:hypothetical protein